MASNIKLKNNIGTNLVIEHKDNAPDTTLDISNISTSVADRTALQSLEGVEGQVVFQTDIALAYQWVANQDVADNVINTTVFKNNIPPMYGTDYFVDGSSMRNTMQNQIRLTSSAVNGDVFKLIRLS